MKRANAHPVKASRSKGKPSGRATVGRVIYRGSGTFTQGDRSIALSRCTIVLDKYTKDSALWFGVFALANPDRDLGTSPDATLVLEDGRRGEVRLQHPAIYWSPGTGRFHGNGPPPGLGELGPPARVPDAGRALRKPHSAARAQPWASFSLTERLRLLGFQDECGAVGRDGQTRKGVIDEDAN
jgi:hypothetical protein